jgi:integrase
MPLELKPYVGPRGRVFYAVGSVDGRRINRSTGLSDRRLARKRLLEIEMEVASSSSAPSTPPLSDALPIYLGRTNPVGPTSEAYCTRFAERHPSVTVDKITPAMVLAHCQSRSKAPSTIRREIAAIQGFLNHMRLIADLQPLRIKKPASASPKSTKFSKAERDRLLAICLRDARWFYPHLLTYFLTGLRRSELIKLTWDDIIYDEADTPSIMLVRSRKGTSGRLIERRIPIHPKLAPLITQLESDQRPSPKDRVYRNSLGGPIGCSSLINKTLSPLLHKAGLSHLSTHDIRRTFASDLLAAEVSDHRISDLLGHIDLKMLKTYAVIEDNLRLDAVKRIPTID